MLELGVHAGVEDHGPPGVLDQERADREAHRAGGAGEHPAGLGGEPAALEGADDEPAAVLELAHQAQPPA